MSRIQAAQLWGMTRYEFRMHWRRRGLIILTWSVLVVVGISLLVAGGSLDSLRSVQADPAQVREVATTTLILTMFSPIGMGLVFFLPLIAAETIPLDRQYGVRELLDTTPLSPNTYLLGKLLGLWAAVLSAMGLVMLLVGVLWWFKTGPFNVGDYLEVWVVAVGAIIILNGSLGVLIPAGQSTRRQAILVTIVGMFVLMIIFGGAMDNDDLAGMLSIVRGPILNYYVFNKSHMMGAVPSTIHVPSFQNVLATMGVGLIEVAVLFGLARLWTGWLDSKR